MLRGRAPETFDSGANLDTWATWSGRQSGRWVVGAEERAVLRPKENGNGTAL